jgi:hypothetical protein
VKRNTETQLFVSETWIRIRIRLRNKVKILVRIRHTGFLFINFLSCQATIKTELYPRSQIDIFVEVLQADGGNYCACVNAATLALIDAGIPLKDYVTACTASLGWIYLVDVFVLKLKYGRNEVADPYVFGPPGSETISTRY